MADTTVSVTTRDAAIERFAAMLWLEGLHEEDCRSLSDFIEASDHTRDFYLRAATETIVEIGAVFPDPALVEAVKAAKQEDFDHIARGGHRGDVRARNAERALKALGVAVFAQLGGR
jgi:hypothetical protein